VEPDGSISNPEIVRDIGAGCGEEALRIVNMMPEWIPGRQRGKAVRVQFNLPVRFDLVDQS
jgi:protein TonB